MLSSSSGSDVSTSAASAFIACSIYTRIGGFVLSCFGSPVLMPRTFLESLDFPSSADSGWKTEFVFASSWWSKNSLISWAIRRLSGFYEICLPALIDGAGDLPSFWAFCAFWTAGLSFARTLFRVDSCFKFFTTTSLRPSESRMGNSAGAYSFSFYSSFTTYAGFLCSSCILSSYSALSWTGILLQGSFDSAATLVGEGAFSSFLASLGLLRLLTSIENPFGFSAIVFASSFSCAFLLAAS